MNIQLRKALYTFKKGDRAGLCTARILVADGANLDWNDTLITNDGEVNQSISTLWCGFMYLIVIHLTRLRFLLKSGLNLRVYPGGFNTMQTDFFKCCDLWNQQKDSKYKKKFLDRATNLMNLVREKNN